MNIKEIISKYANLTHYADIESRGLWDDVHSLEDIWCLCSVVEDPETGEDKILLFHDYPKYDNAEVWDEHDKKSYVIPERMGSLLDGFRLWYSIGQSVAGKLSVHNCMTYDKPIIEKVMPKCKIPNEKWDDTFIHSKIQWFDRPTPKGAKSGHGLKAYGIVHGINKPDIKDWTFMDEYKLHRVIEDVKIQKMTTEFLARERRTLKLKLGINFEKAYKEEQEYAIACHKQEVYGAKLNVAHIKSCIEYLDKTTEALAEYLEPLLPLTVKATTSQKITRKDLAIQLGFPEEVTSKMVVPKEKKIIKGEEVWAEVKPYYKPTTNFLVKKKGNMYSGMHLSYGFSPSYPKKKMLTDWIKENHPDTKPKDWDIEKTETVQELLNQNTCKYFDLNPEDTDIVVGAHTKVKFEDSKLTQHEKVKAFLIMQGITWAEEWNPKKDPKTGQVVRADKRMKIYYPPKAARHNQIVHTIEKGEAIVTSPKFGDKEYEQLETEVGKDVAKYNTLMHRRRYLENLKDPENKGLMAYLNDRDRVPAGVNNFGTATGRATHRVIVNLPADGAVFGKEMRECVVADEGKELVGIDQKSSQLSIAAFVTNNTEYYNAVATGLEMKNEEDGSETYVGTSAHCVNSRYFNLVTKDEWERAVVTQEEELVHSITLRRKQGKSLSFASLFGCGPKKLALMGGFTEKEATIKLKSFLDNMGLTGVIEYLEGCKKKYPRGKGFYIPTAFGYWVYCGGIHKAVNYLIQGIESCVQKRAVILMEREIIKRGWQDSVNKILDMHDEVLFECDKGMGIEVGKMSMDCYTQAGIDLHNYFKDNIKLYSGGGTPKITCDFAGSYSVGVNYAECH